MDAFYEVQRSAGEPKRLMRVGNVRSPQHAEELRRRIEAAHADSARLLALEDYALHYTASEVERERNLLGGPRRHSTGSGTVTIPGE